VPPPAEEPPPPLSQADKTHDAATNITAWKILMYRSLLIFRRSVNETKLTFRHYTF
jgi:hypothetical protein